MLQGRRKVVLIAFSLAVSLGAVGWFVYRMGDNWGGLLDALRQADYWCLVPAIALLALSYVLRIWRWHLFLKPVADVPFSAVASATCIGFMSTVVLPLRAGEVIRPYVLSRKARIGFGHAVGTDAGLARVFDLLFGLGFLFLLAWGWILLDPAALGGGAGSAEGAGALAEQAKRLTGQPVVAAIFAASVLGPLVVLAFPSLVLRAAEVVLRAFPDRWEQVLMGFTRSVVEALQFLRSPVRTIGAVLLTMGLWITFPAITYCMARGFGMPLTPLAAVVIQVILTVAIMVPQAPGFLGVFQAATMEGTRLFGVGEGMAGAFAIVLWAIHVVPIAIVGLGYAWYEGLSLRGLAREAAASHDAAALGEQAADTAETAPES